MVVITRGVCGHDADAMDDAARHEEVRSELATRDAIQRPHRVDGVLGVMQRALEQRKDGGRSVEAAVVVPQFEKHKNSQHPVAHGGLGIGNGVEEGGHDATFVSLQVCFDGGALGRYFAEEDATECLQGERSVLRGASLARHAHQSLQQFEVIERLTHTRRTTSRDGQQKLEGAAADWAVAVVLGQKVTRDNRRDAFVAHAITCRFGVLFGHVVVDDHFEELLQRRDAEAVDAA
mmetsp:Transcript_55072/g.169677  ORF Transcript_55072/g.169677 Transcript_55072/m.169677 type:complete len:234 (+) Transcript_55072:298-999(+)